MPMKYKGFNFSTPLSIPFIFLVTASWGVGWYLVIWMRNAPTGSGVWTFCPQSIKLFGEVMEPVGGSGLLEGVCHWGQTSRVYSFAPLLFFLSASCVVWKCHQPSSSSCSQALAVCCQAFLTMMDDSLSLRSCNPNQPLLSEVAFH